MSDPQREWEHLRKLATANPHKRFGRLVVGMARPRLREDFTGEPGAARSGLPGAEGAGRRRASAMG